MSRRTGRGWRVLVASAAFLAAASQVPAQDAGTAAADAEATTTGKADAPPGHSAYFDLRRITPITGDAARGATRTELCSACHGDDGISIVPIYPDIAGQRADYMYWQLVKFKDAGFGGTVMAVAVEGLSDQDMKDLSLYYAGLPAAGSPPDPAEAADDTEDPPPPPDPALLARGEQLYMHGEPASGIPPCQGCHGADARGHPDAYKADAAGFTPYAVYPALRGQRDAYLMTRIAEYQEGKHTSLTSDFVMGGAATHLDQASVEALATWLSSLPR